MIEQDYQRMSINGKASDLYLESPFNGYTDYLYPRAKGRYRWPLIPAVCLYLTRTVKYQGTYTKEIHCLVVPRTVRKIICKKPRKTDSASQVNMGPFPTGKTYTEQYITNNHDPQFHRNGTVKDRWIPNLHSTVHNQPSVYNSTEAVRWRTDEFQVNW